MGQLERAGQKIFDVLNAGKHMYGFAAWGMRLGAGKMGTDPSPGSWCVLRWRVPTSVTAIVVV